MNTLEILADLERLAQGGLKVERKAFVGFDGFVDKITRAVKKRTAYTITYFDSIRDFSERVREAEGRSGQIELKTERVKMGGNAPIFANALGKLGIECFCACACGTPVVHDVFKTMDGNCELFSVLDPGVSQALEFKDGKIILSELDAFEYYDWKYIKTHCDFEKIRTSVSTSGACAFLDWANLHHSSDIWEGVLYDIIKPSGRKDYTFLFDLCDPSRKTVMQIDELLDLISCFSSYGKVVLGLNENETLKIWAAINGQWDEKDPALPGLIEAADCLYKTMDIQYLLIHTTDRSILFYGPEKIVVKGKVVLNPKVLTGAGDNLNAGFMLGILADLPIEHCVILGMAASGAYIENGSSPTMNELANFINQWKSALQTTSTGVVSDTF